MSSCIYFEPLTADHVEAMADVERAVHREHNVHGLEDLKEELVEADQKGNLSLAVFDGARMVGYVLAYLEPEGCEDGSGEPSVYVSDLGLLPGYRRLLPEVLGRWSDRLHAELAQHPLEAHSFAPELEKWRVGLAPLFADLGFRLADQRKVDEEDGLEQFWIRFDPCPAPSQDPRDVPALASHEVAGERYDVRVTQHASHWARLEPFWNVLVSQTPDATGFQSFEYLNAWWRCFGLERRRLLILTFWCGRELRGIAPLTTRAVRTLAGWKRELSFVGTGWEVDRPSFLFGVHGEACTEVLTRCLDSEQAPWDRAHLFEQVGDAPYLPQLGSWAKRRRHYWRAEKDTTSAYLRLEGSFEDFLSSRSRHFRKRVRSAVRKLEEAGELRFERCTDWPRVAEELVRYRELEARSWKHGREEGLGEAKRSRFYDEMLQWLGPKGRFHVLSLTLDGRLISSTIAMVYESLYYSLQIVHDAEFDRYSPGTVLEYYELRDCFESGWVEYDFLGGHLNNKGRWTSSFRDTSSFYLEKRTLASIFKHAWLLRLRPLVLDLLERSGLRMKVLTWHGNARDWLIRRLNG